MLGAILGDIIGSTYELNNVKTKDFPLRTTVTRYTDDTVMTLAVAKWLLEDTAHSEEALVKCMQKLGRAHIRAGYGGRFLEWLLTSDPQPYNSWGNGSAMRVSPVGLFAESESEARDLAHITASVTHNHPEGIKGAEAVAMAVYINKCHAACHLEQRKKLTREYIEEHFCYDLGRKLDDIRPSYTFDVSCQGSVPEAIIAYLESESIEDCIRNAISIGGDSDTIAAIACSIFMAGENSKKEGNEWTISFEKYLSTDLKLIMSDFEEYVFPAKPTYNSYKVMDWLWAGEYPGDRSEGMARLKLRQFKRFGITHFIDLTEDGELKAYKHLLDFGINYQRFPIIDQYIPRNTESVRKLIDSILKIHNENPDAVFYIHCWGGVGRTGTIVGCFLGYSLQMDYENAVSELKRLFEDCPKSANRVSPENSDQFEFIKRFLHMEKINKQYTPDKITSLADNEVFVFGSNLAGSHGGGAARLAYERFGAVWGEGVGLHGQSYAIPTMQGGVGTIKPYVDEFIRFAKENRQLTFFVTRIGCGIAGFRDEEMAPLFEDALELGNVILPKEFVESLAANAPITPTANEIVWNSADFLAAYHPLMQKADKGDRVTYYKVKELRTQEYRNTIEIVNQGFYTTEEGKRVTFPDLTRMEHETAFYEREFRVDDIPAREEETKFVVRNVDCLEEGVRLSHEGYNPAVLNMASRRCPGGGVMLGAGAQEETLFRRTNLFRSLYQFTEDFIEHIWYKQNISPAESGHRYPLNHEFGGIYTPGALLFRMDEQRGYKLMDSPEHLSFIAVAGINRPKLKDATHLADSMIEGTKNKMRTILRIGLRHGHDSLVLGALGCGAFCNPPSHIARLFHEVFEEPEFKNKYRLISFAILDDHNAHRSHNPEGNYKPFVDEFGSSDKSSF